MTAKQFALAVAALAALLLAPLVYNGFSTVKPPVKVITVDGSETQQTIASLREKAAVIAIVTFDKTVEMQWNSTDGQEWQTDSAARPAMIYRDDAFKIQRVLRGNFSASSVVIRGVGGRIGDTEFVYRDQPEWRTGRSYLVMLREVPTPFEGGKNETAWTLVSMAQGTFEKDPNGTWRNELSVPVVEADLERT